jgi:pSer/pThr/pTyr-binding forkhead associated (FHA) protein
MSDELDYLDFEITVKKTGEERYLLHAESGTGSAEVLFDSPFNEDKRALIAATLTKVALRSSAKVRSSSAPEVKKMREMGSTLCENAIAGPVRELYYKCQGQADQQGKGIRWRLSLDPAISDLPWEFLYLQDEFLALNPRSPVVRYIKGASRVAPLKTEHPLKLLVVIASPKDEVPLNTSAEKDRITAAIQSLTEKGLVEVTFIEGPDTWKRLIDALLSNQTHILHFIGHGAFDEKNNEGVLIMEDAEGMATRIDSERLRVLVQGKSRLRMVVLNSCLGTQGDEGQPFSSMAAGLVRSGIPAVIAMQFEISDHAAQEIAETFYRSLALNMPVDAAVTEARRKIFLSDRDSLEWATPILFMQVPDGQLFQFNLEKSSADTSSPPTVSIDPVAHLVRSGTRDELPLFTDEIRIGRGTDNDIVLNDQTISRKHATLTRTGNTYSIENNARTGGTWVNSNKVTTRTLKSNDVIRIGNIEFRFQLPVAARDTFGGAEKEPEESLTSKAAKRYRDGEEKMADGEWTEAAKAFRGALLFVPDYRDAAQRLSICEKRDKAAKLYDQAQNHCADKKYHQALQALNEIAALDHSFVDTTNVRTAAELGQKYNRALGELQLGNTDRGAELLREVISCQADYEDASERLTSLAEGGNGLVAGERLVVHQNVASTHPSITPLYSSPPVPQPPPQQPSTQGYETRHYECAKFDAKRLAEEIRQYFFSNGHESQIVEQGQLIVVQGQKTGFRSWVGMGQAATMMIEPSAGGAKISVGGAKWLEQGAAMAVSMVVLWPLLITAGVGMAQQKELLNTLWRMAENFVVNHGGRRVQ